MNKQNKLLIGVLAIFIVGMTLGVAFAEPVDAKPIAKIKKAKSYYTAKFKYKGHKYTAKLKKNKKESKYYESNVYDTTKKIKGHKFRLYHSTYSEGFGSVKGWNFCKLRNSPIDSHLYYKVKWV